MDPKKDGGAQPLSKRQLALSWSKDDLISTFKQTPEFKPNGCDVTGFVFPPTKYPIAYVKFSLASERRAELHNQEYAFKALREMPLNQTQGILIPEIYCAFEYSENFFIVIEYISGRTLIQLAQQPGWESQQISLSNSIARAIGLLMSIKPPLRQRPGPIKDILRLPEDNLKAMQNIFNWFTIGVAYLGTVRRPRH
ncbi:hypothetical protein LA080_003450 [Diaporthe eres]|nr:hypothetical protein LA080_003450 [Diaporthe eres]